MSDEVPTGLPPVEDVPTPLPASRPRPSGVRRRLAHWLAELATVFVGVYAAFFLNNHASHRQERQRREQILTWVEDRYTGVRGNALEQSAVLHGKIDEFNAKLAAGQMPEVKPISWTGDYDPSDSVGLLQSGGYDLLDVETIRDMRGVESTLRHLVSVATRAQQRSDALILPNRGKDPAVFYDPATHQLRESYDWVPKVYEDLKEDFEALQTSCTKLLAQVHAEREHGH